MHPPISVDLLFDLLQMRTAYGKRHTIFQNSHTVLDLDNMYHVDNTAPVNIDKLFCSQFLINLLQTFTYLGYSSGGNNAGIFPITLDIINLPAGYLFKTAVCPDGISFSLFQLDQLYCVPYGGWETCLFLIFGNI